MTVMQINAAGVLVLILSSLSSAYSGGNGTASDPYQIATLADWQQLIESTTDHSSHFKLTADLDFDGLSIGSLGEFAGVLDGNGLTIRNAVIDLPEQIDVGLFSCIDYDGEITDLGVESITISGRDNVGSIAGFNRGKIERCYATGTVIGIAAESEGGIGGFIGKNYGTIKNCYAISSISSVNGTVTTPYWGVGGFAGYNGGLIVSCYAAGSVSGPNSLGGFLGCNDHGTTTDCFWDIDATGITFSAGGKGFETALLQIPETYLRSFWDFRGEIANGSQDVWAISRTGGYPILGWQADELILPNDYMSDAIAVQADSSLVASNVGATGLDLTLNGYNDNCDVWYLFEPSSSGKYTISIENSDFDSTLAVFDSLQRKIVFNDDYFGGTSLVVLKATTGKSYYIRIAGNDGQTGQFTLSITSGAVQEIQGDLNYDGFVNLVDFTLMAENWLLSH